MRIISSYLKAQPILQASELTVYRPQPIVEDIPVLEYAKHIDPRHAAEALLEGNYVLIADQFSSGITVLEALRKILSKSHTNDSFRDQRNFREHYRKSSRLLLIEISDHRLHVRKAPEIGWIKRLYPDIPDFFLPFTEVQGLNSSWQWYEKGIRIPGLKEPLHPFYGTYFPTRFEHIELFVAYLKTYSGSKSGAFDIGIGSGILSKLLLQFGFHKVHASDINPNALIGMLQPDHQAKNKNNLILYFGDLFAESGVKNDLVVFNPPWIPLPKEVSGIDLAIYYDQGLFPRFFEEASRHLNPDGRVVLIFSNLAELMDPEFKHPIEAELKAGNRFELVEKLTKKVGAASSRTKRKAVWRDRELVECWILKLKNER